MKNAVKDLPDCAIITVANSSGSAYVSGQKIIVGGKLGVCMTDIANGASGAVATAGQFKLPKATGVSYSVGQTLGWDAANSRVTAGALGGVRVEVVEAVVNADTEVKCNINYGAGGLKFTKKHTVSAGEDSANQVDFDVGFPVANAVIHAQLESTAGLTRPCTITRNPGSSAPTTVRVADANLAVNEIINIIVENPAGV